MRSKKLSLAFSAALAATLVSANVAESVLDACPGYNAAGVVASGSTLTANLTLAGEPCNVYGNDIERLKLEVTYETSKVYVGHTH